MSWAPLPVETDPDAVTARLLAAMLEALNPSHDPDGWVAREGAPEVVLVEEIGRETALTNLRAADAADAAAAGFGIGLYGFPAILGAPATIAVLLTVTGAGAVVPAGFTVVGRTTDGIDIAFTLRDQVTSIGTTAAATLVAQVNGAVGNGVPAAPLTVITATATVITVAATAVSANGVDAESRDAYLGRLADFVAVLRPGGVRASDLTVLARSVPGVARALAVDLFDADTNTTGAERTVSVYPVDSAGQPVGTAVATALRAALEAVREVNFRIRVATPTYTAVAVAITAVAETGADPVAVAAAVRAAVISFLSPARWGAPTTDPGGWTATSLVRYLALARAAGSVQGLAYLSSITINGGTADVTLPGVAALPSPVTGASPTTITVAVS